jgi:hypothetical protein
MNERVAGCWNSLLVAGYLLLVAGYLLLIAGYSLLVTGFLFFCAFNEQQVTSNQLKEKSDETSHPGDSFFISFPRECGSGQWADQRGD